MSRLAELIADLEHEAASTRPFLEALPADQFDFKPHDKSMTLGRLASHTAETYAWLRLMCIAPEFAAEGYTPFNAENPETLLEAFDANVSRGIACLGELAEAALSEPWRLTHEGAVMLQGARLEIIKSFVLHHLIHHRAQLGVYLRLLDLPLPAAYGPSADEQSP